MINKHLKVLKLQLFSIFLITIISFGSFYYGDSLPDNYYQISSSQEGLNVISYYLTSALVAIGEFTGPWLFIPFVIFALFYSFLYSRRHYIFDLLNIFSLVFACLFFSLLLVRESVGRGLAYYLELYITTSSMVLSAAFFLFLFLAGSFRESFKKTVFDFVFYLSLIPSFSWRFVQLLNPIQTISHIKKTFSHLNKILRRSISTFLKGQENNSFRQDKKVEKNVDEFNSSYNFSQDNNQTFSATQSENVESKSDERTKTSQSKKEASVKLSTQNQSASYDGDYYRLVDQISLLPQNEGKNGPPGNDYFSDIVQRIEDKLGEFNIEGKIINILKGPVVDTFELELGAGVKVSRVNSAEDDLSLALFGAPVRIVYPMLGKTTVGIEVPRKPRDVIYLDEVIDSREFQNNTNRLPIAMGQNAFGETTVVDLAAMPHMLIAGATGAGKSVFINTLLVSLLIKKSPRQMKLILIDPKQLELALYQKLPHLILPVVTDPKKAAISLIWACQEMDRRYSILKEMGVRGIEGFNEKIQQASPEQLSLIHQYYDNADEEGYELPYIVIIIDEFADLILTKAGKEIETNVSRLAAKARAAGMHIVLATQRPSVDVITGVIKSNFPTRVSFRVTGINDSRTILDAKGAEKLLGKGDMLYKHGTSSMRLHSAYIDEVDVERFVSSLSSISPKFNESALDFLENGGDVKDDPYAYPSGQSFSNSSSDTDDRFDEALQVVLEQGVASASMLQRRLRVGYNRASNLIDELESKGVIGPAQGSKPRKVIGPPSSHP